MEQDSLLAINFTFTALPNANYAGVRWYGNRILKLL